MESGGFLFLALPKETRKTTQTVPVEAPFHVVLKIGRLLSGRWGHWKGTEGRRTPGKMEQRRGGPHYGLRACFHSDFCRHQEAEKRKKGKRKR